jgi:protein-disulfide isomerase
MSKGEVNMSAVGKLVLMMVLSIVVPPSSVQAQNCYAGCTGSDYPAWDLVWYSPGAACLRSDSATVRLEADIALGRRLGIFATPSFVARTGVHHGLMVDSILKDHIVFGSR